MRPRGSLKFPCKKVDANPVGAHDDDMSGKSIAIPVLVLCTLFLLPSAFLFSQSAENALNPIITEYTFENYRRHPRMEEKDGTLGRDFSWKPGLEIITDIDDAEIRILGETVGRTPWEENNLASGAYDVTLRKTGYADMKFRVVHNSRKRTVVIASLKQASGRLTLAGLPPGAEVRLDHQMMEGSSFETAAGKRMLEIRAFGWEPVSKSVTVAPGETTEWTFMGVRTPFSIEMERPRPNILPPDDPEGFTLKWKASAPGQAKIIITDSNGNTAAEIPILISSPSGSISWPPMKGSADEDSPDSSDSPAGIREGTYSVLIEGTGEDGVVSSDEESFAVDSRFERRVFPGRSFVPGLNYAAGTGVLPPGSFQLSTGTALVLGTESSLSEEGIPAYFSFRVSPAALWDIGGRFGLTIRDSRKNNSLDFSFFLGWRIPLNAGPFSAKIALLFAYSGASSDFGRIPEIFSGPRLPGPSLIFPMELSLGDVSLILSPAAHLFFLGDDSSEYHFAPPARFAGSLGFGVYYQSGMFLIGASGALRTPDIGSRMLDWNLMCGLESRIDFPGHRSFLNASAGVNLLDADFTAEIGLEFGIIL